MAVKIGKIQHGTVIDHITAGERIKSNRSVGSTRER
ncbi:MAG: aspartate carbamoyltransferase regulatory subunit [Candidatus Aenigmarchaeota archaeon]|nr:aspartate carbamoyltransferase regulatory subunit [Candidatus Aenigmarchaeota archaeon]